MRRWSSSRIARLPAAPFTVGSVTISIDLNPAANQNEVCPDGALPDEFLEVLGEATTYQIDGMTLTLELPDDGGSVTLVVPDTTPTPTPAEAATPT